MKNSSFPVFFSLILALKTVFWSSENVFFLANYSFRLVETYFLSSGKSIFLFRALLKLLKFEGGNFCLWKLIFWLVELIFSHFSDTLPSESYFPFNVNSFLNEFSKLYGGCTFSVLWKPFSFI